MGKISRLNDLIVYQKAKQLCVIAWEIYKSIPQEHKFSTGTQFLRATDSICANIAESYGRFHYYDRLNFLYYARGSIYESLNWNDLILSRNLVNVELNNGFEEKAIIVLRQINAQITALRKLTQKK